MKYVEAWEINVKQTFTPTALCTDVCNNVKKIKRKKSLAGVATLRSKFHMPVRFNLSSRYKKFIESTFANDWFWCIRGNQIF